MTTTSVAAQQTQAQQLTALSNAASTAAGNKGGAAIASAAAGTSAKNPLTSLTGNFQDFLQMLMTQLKNQDPSSPMDANTFTTELVQFASVEQQINTNTNLTKMIELTQSGEILNSSAMLGHRVAVESDHMPVQSGAGELRFTATTPGSVAIAVYTDGGVKLADATVDAVKGTNTWKWDGSIAAGGTVADGSYRVAVMGLDASGTPTALPFQVVGTATGVQSQNNTLQLELGPQSVDFSTVKSVLP